MTWNPVPKDCPGCLTYTSFKGRGASKNDTTDTFVSPLQPTRVEYLIYTCKQVHGRQTLWGGLSIQAYIHTCVSLSLSLYIYICMYSCTSNPVQLVLCDWVPFCISSVPSFRYRPILCSRTRRWQTSSWCPQVMAGRLAANHCRNGCES